MHIIFSSKRRVGDVYEIILPFAQGLAFCCHWYDTVPHSPFVLTEKRMAVALHAHDRFIHSFIILQIGSLADKCEFPHTAFRLSISTVKERVDWCIHVVSITEWILPWMDTEPSTKGNKWNQSIFSLLMELKKRARRRHDKDKIASNDKEREKGYFSVLQRTGGGQRTLVMIAIQLPRSIEPKYLYPKSEEKLAYWGYTSICTTNNWWYWARK